MTRFSRIALILAVFAYLSNVTASAQNVILGILEDNHGWYAGDPNFRDVRVVFRKIGQEWRAYPSDCPNPECLKVGGASYPHEVNWTIAFDGRSVGQTTTRAPKDFKWYAAVGQQEIVSHGSVPTVGERSTEFGGYTGASVYRPLVATLLPYFKDPDVWKPSRPSPELTAVVRSAFRRTFPKLCRLGGPEKNRMDAFPYRDQEIGVVKVYSSSSGWAIVRLHLQAVDCADVEAGFDIDDPWFAVAPDNSTSHIGDGMWLVDAGDYDNDGRSELIFIY